MKNPSTVHLHHLNILILPIAFLLIGFTSLKSFSQEWKQGKEVLDYYKGWHGNPDSIKVYIDPSWPDTSKVKIRKGIKKWNDAGGKPKLKEVTSEPAEVTIKKLPASDTKREGVCKNIFYEATGKVIKSEIQLKENPSGLGLEELATHELGHALGLKDTDHKKNTADVMKGKGSNGTGNLSKHDSTELKAAIAISQKATTPMKKASNGKAIEKGKAEKVTFPLDNPAPPGTEIIVTTLEDDQVEVVATQLLPFQVEIDVFIDPLHGSGTFYLDVMLFPPPPDEPVEFIGYHYVHETPVDPVVFDCPFIIEQDAEGYLNIIWEDFCTYPNPDVPLRSHLYVNESAIFLTKPIGDYRILLDPGMYEITLTVDDYQVNSASFSMMYEVPVMPSTVTLGQGTDSNSPTGWPTPYGTYYKNFRQQYLIHASELINCGFGEGPITAIAFDVAALNNCSPMPNYTIQLKHTNAQELTSVFDNEPYQLVWSHPEFLPVQGWNTHQFFEPFFWNGFENVLIDICCDLIPGYYTQNASVFYTPTEFYSCLRFQSDNENACGTSNNGTLSVNRANMQITGTNTWCAPPYDLIATDITPVSAILKWESYANHLMWNAEVGYPGFLPGTGQALQSQTGTDINFWPVEGLEPVTNYEFYVQAVCNDGSLSNWSLPCPFTTSCGIFDLPFIEFFNQAEFPECWSQSFEGSLTSERWTVNNTSNAGGEPFEMMANDESKTGISRLITPVLNLETGVPVMLEFNHFYDDYGDGCAFKIQSSIDGFNWIDEGFMFMSGNGDIGPEMVSLPIGNLSPNTQIAWVIDGNHGSFDNWFIDDVQLTFVSTEPPEVYAGADALIIEGDTYQITDATAQNYSSLLWTSSGDGEFDDPTILHSTYFPGNQDIQSGLVNLCLTASEIPPGTGSVSDCMILYIVKPLDFTLIPNGKTNPEPWYRWITGIENATPVYLTTSYPDSFIQEIKFWFTQNPALEDWIWFYTDEDGSSNAAPGGGENYAEEKDGWCGYLNHSQLDIAMPEVYFKAEVFLITGDIIEIASDIVLNYDQTPPDSYTLNIPEDYYTDQESVSLQITPVNGNLLFAEVQQTGVVTDVYDKNFPTLGQPDSVSCGPTSLAMCLKYFTGHDSTQYGQITGGLTDVQLIDSLKIYLQTDTSGTTEKKMYEGAKRWIENHGGGFTVSPTKPFSEFGNDELTRHLRNDGIQNGVSQNMISMFEQIDSTGKKSYHWMTLSSVHPPLNTGNSRYDYCDPQNNMKLIFDVDDNGLTSDWAFDDGEPIPDTIFPWQSVKIRSTMMICPNEPSNISGQGQITEGPDFQPVEVPLPPTSGRTAVRVRAVDEEGNKSETDITITRVPPTTYHPLDTIVRAGDPPFRLLGGNPPGGNFSGNHIFDDWFFPDEPGIFPIIYSVEYPGFVSSCEFTITVVADFGDAPDSYKTLLASDGARHVISNVIYLGNLVDGEPDGQPSANANGDDLLNLDDEDGVTFNSPFVGGQQAKITVKASTVGFLNAWLDVNINGTFADAGEQVFTDQALQAGFNILTFDIPNNAGSGFTFMRFRFDVQGGLNYFGQAGYGEVEDYRINILPEMWSFTITNQTHLINIPFDIGTTGFALIPGDIFGVFFNNDNKNYYCGGAAVFDGLNNQVMNAYGDDLTTPEKEGFDEGEWIKWKVYFSSTGQEEWINVVYDPDEPNSDGTFSGNGLSALLSAGINNHSLELLSGWSGVSTCFVPADPEIETMFAPVVDELIIMYNFSGTYWPSIPLNTLDLWDVYSGYVIKMTDDVILPLTGYEFPDKTVELTVGWNIIPALSNVPALDVLGGLNGFKVAKGVASPEILWPEYNINTLSNLLTGKSYFVYMTQEGTINFAGSSKVSILQQPAILPGNPWNDLTITPYTHLVAFTTESLKTLKAGDLIAAFNSAGYCTGTAEISDLNRETALILYGDDPTTAKAEGFTGGEQIILKCYRPSSGELFDLDVTWNEQLNHSGLFETNGLSAIVGIKTGPMSTTEFLQAAVAVYPNPTQKSFTISGVKGEYTIKIYDALGEEIFENQAILPVAIDFSNQPEGIYIIEISNNEQFIYKKLILSK
ncbi:MAG TPA: GEVED domain-containing protein [Bacteroidales bacterium]|nr:GEVED domain-containing protein [Bacteroidales bacterium]